MSNFYPEPPPPPVQTSSPVRHSKPQEDWRIKAIAIMTTAGGGVALLFGLINILAAFVMCITLVSGAYSLVVGALCLATGIPMLSKPAYGQRPPYTTAIMQVVNILACDPINLALGIVILVFLSDPAVKAEYYQ